MSRLIKGPVALVVLDGWGLREDEVNNGVAMAKTPVYDKLVKTYPFTKLVASGEAVGLPEGQMGNSEVGHTTIGAGTVIYQDLVKIHKALHNGEFETNKAFQEAFAHVLANKSAIHIMGVFSNGGVHGHQEHFFGVIEAALRAGVEKIVVHPFLDGRDSANTSGIESIRMLEEFVEKHPQVVIGSVMGRYYSMDRDTNWDRTNRAFEAIFNGKADHVYKLPTKPSTIIQEWYHKEIFDEHLEPMVYSQTGVVNGDGIIFTNFRKDRAKQLSLKIMEQVGPRQLFFVTMSDYGDEIKATVAFVQDKVKDTLASEIEKAGLKQAHLAETEKFPHATYFLNGGKQEAYANEEHVLVPSRKDIKAHDQAPEMKAREICDEAISRLEKNDFIFVNFANPDMVGHTANQSAIITAVETVDTQLGRLVEAVLKHDGALVVIADHGNAEVMVDPVTGLPHTSHTTNPVPCILISDNIKDNLRNDNSGLIDVAPTVLKLLGLANGESMTGEALI